MPVTWREVVGILLLVVLSDLTIYRGEGFAGDAALFALAPLLLWIGASRRGSRWPTLAVGLLMLLAAARLVWCGSGLLIACGWALLFAFSMTLVGLPPFALEALVFASQTIRSGYEGLKVYGSVLERKSDAQPQPSSCSPIGCARLTVRQRTGRPPAGPPFNGPMSSCWSGFGQSSSNWSPTAISVSVSTHAGGSTSTPISGIDRAA